MASWTWVTWLSASLAFIMTGLLVTSRVSLMWLLRLYKYEQIHPATWYASVLILLVAPHVTHLVKVLWDTPIISPANRDKFPAFSKIIIGVLGSILEGMATAVFASEISPVLSEPVLLTLPYATLAFYLISTVSRHLLKTRRATEEGKEQQKQPEAKKAPCLFKDFWCLVAALYTLCVPVGVGVMLNMWSSFRFNVPECTAMCIALITIGGVWTPDIQKAAVTSSKSKNRCQLVELIYVPVKITAVALTIFTCLVFKLKDFRQNMGVFLSAVLIEFEDFRIWLPITLCVIAGFMCLMCSIVSSKIGLMTAGVKMPLLISPVVVMFTVVVTWNDFQTDAFWELWGNDPFSWAAFGLSAVTWLIPFFFPALGILKSPCKPGRDAKDSFISFSWQSFFMEPNLILNYERCSIGKRCRCPEEEKDGRTTKKGQVGVTMSSGRKRVFICTTMYKESDKEMKRYMNSIKDVMYNFKEATVDIEAHVFFDGSVEDGRVNTRGRHLVSLLCETFGLRLSHLEKNKTPYGCQIHTGSLLPYPVFIHFKDTLKVKSKKRWSQVMYLHYLLQFRCRDRFGNHHSKIDIKSKEGRFTSVVKDERFINNANGDDNNLDLDQIKIHNDFIKTNSKSDTTTNNNMGVYIKSANGESHTNHWIHRRQQARKDNYAHDGVHSSHCVVTNGDGSRSNSNPSIRSSLDHCDRLIFTQSCRGMHTWDELRMPSDLSCTDDGLALKTGVGKKGSSIDDHASFSYKDIPGNCGKTEKDGASVFTIGNHSFSDDQSSYNLDDIHEALPWFWNQAGRNSSALEDVYLLATDADTEFTSHSVADVLCHVRSDVTVGAVCGRTVPVGSSKPIVWYQKFEYAKDFWLVKASQNIIGSVTCCPGCFTLYRASAIGQVCQEFSQPTTSAFDSMVKDHGEDRWLCTLLMQRGWRLAYSTHAHNSTHCPETVGEFLRQRRRWVLSELSNMAAIFMTMPRLVRHNQSFSGMFIISLVMTFLWVISSPATTLVFLCAGGEVLFSVPIYVTVPSALVFFVLNTVVCCVASQRKQKLTVMAVTVVMAITVLALSVGFVVYVVRIMENDLIIWGSVQFRPYFLVFFLVLAIIYAALLHPRESLSLVYGLSYALLFPAMFVLLPVYALANMVDQSWGTREVGSRGCCQQPQEEEDEHAYKEFAIKVSDLLNLSDRKESLDENAFWMTLKKELIGVKVNAGIPQQMLSQDLDKLRRRCVSVFVLINVFWFVCLSLLQAFTGSDVTCYLVASIFSFSLLLQLIGLTSYKCNSLIKKYLSEKNALALTFNPTSA